MIPTSVAELAYIELGVSSLSDWQRYSTEVLGLSVKVDNESLLLKMDTSIWRKFTVQRPHSLKPSFSKKT